MSDPTLSDYKLRLLIHKEWKSGSNKNDAFKNIQLKFKDISMDLINDWYKNFSDKIFSIFHEDQALYISTKNDPLDSLLLLIEKREWWEDAIVKNGQFVIYYYHNAKSENAIFIYDLFNDIKRWVFNKLL